jgi:hypothetical protein
VGGGVPSGLPERVGTTRASGAEKCVKAATLFSLSCNKFVAIPSRRYRVQP